jgi:hypothetical protein
VVLAPGTYRYGGPVSIGDNTTLRGAGGTVLVPRDPLASALKLGGKRPAVRGLALRSGATQRTGRWDASGICIDEAEDVRLDDVEISGTSAAGVIVSRARRVRIAGCSVTGGLADGFHVTARSSRVQILGCQSRDNGDDLFACVGYEKDGGPVEQVVIANNIGGNGRARGIACVGACHVVIAGNIVDGTDAAGLYLHQEDNYKTYGSYGIAVSANIFSNASRRVGHAGLFIGGGTGSRTTAEGALVSNAIAQVTLSGNILDGSGNDGAFVSRYAEAVRGAGNIVQRAKGRAARMESGDSAVEFLAR